MVKPSRRARLGDIEAVAMGMPFAKVDHGTKGLSIYRVGSKSFVYFRNPRPDTVGADGERLRDVIVFWVESEEDKQSLIQDNNSPFFSTPHFDGHLSVLLRAAHVGELTLEELTEAIQDSWLVQASPKRALDWLRAHGLEA